MIRLCYVDAGRQADTIHCGCGQRQVVIQYDKGRAANI